MRLLLQRVSEAKVTIDGDVTGRIGQGIVALVGLGAGDSESLFRPAAEKIVNLRIFPDDEGKMNRSLAEIGGGILAVSQFTLYADARKGRRPSYITAMPPDQARGMFDLFLDVLRDIHQGPVETGRFGAMMDVQLVNDGPVTIWLDSSEMPWGGSN